MAHFVCSEGHVISGFMTRREFRWLLGAIRFAARDDADTATDALRDRAAKCLPTIEAVIRAWDEDECGAVTELKFDLPSVTHPARNVDHDIFADLTPTEHDYMAAGEDDLDDPFDCGAPCARCGFSRCQCAVEVEQ